VVHIPSTEPIGAERADGSHVGTSQSAVVVGAADQAGVAPATR
jgi:hypothetical protein